MRYFAEVTLTAVFGAALVAVVAACGGDDDGTTGPSDRPTTGTVAVAATTTGDDPDANGYSVMLDGAERAAIGSNGSVNLTSVNPGNRLVSLSGVAENCAVGGEHPRSVSVTAGATSQAAFEVSCVATVGSIEVTVTTSGDTPEATDPDGYTLFIDGSEVQAIDANAQITIAGASMGVRQVGLSGVAVNCSVIGENPRSVDVPVEGSAEVFFEVECAATGALRLTVASLGGGPYPSNYTISLDGGAAENLALQDTVSYYSLTAGDHEILLGGLGDYCLVAGGNPIAATVAIGHQTELALEVWCDWPLTLWLMSADGSSQHPLTEQQHHNLWPSWSPDGSRIAVFSNRSGEWHLYLMNADGSGTIRLTNESVGSLGADPFAPARWTPDGSRLVFARRSGHQLGTMDLFSIAEDGSDEWRLTADPAWYTRWSISPDGTRIAFNRYDDGMVSLHVMNADGTGLVELYPDGGEGVDWSNDGTRLLFSCGQDICVMNADGGAVSLVTRLPEDEYKWAGDALWSPDESRILFHPAIWNGWTWMGNSVLVDADGSNLTLVTGSHDAPHGDHAWSPDGEWIYFEREMRPPSLDVDLWRIRPDGSGETNLTQNTRRDDQFAVSPNGAEIVFRRPAQ